MKTHNLIIAGLFLIAVNTADADWLIKTYLNGSSINNLSDADAVISGSSPIASRNVGLGDFVGFNTGEGTGHFSINNPVPGISQAVHTDNYAVQGTGLLFVPSAGTYTFGLNTDDGARLRIDGAAVITDNVRQPPHDSPYVAISLAAGTHPIEWTWYNTSGGVNGGGAEAEIFASPSVKQGFDSSFNLVGGGTGLAVSPPLVLTTTRQPATSLTAKTSVTNDQLEIYQSSGQFVPYGSGGGSFDKSQPTIVLTHGWNSSPGAAFNDINGTGSLAKTIKDAHPGYNIVAWDWQKDADTGLNLGRAVASTPSEGAGLGGALLSALGANYSQSLQFIGHSLGTLVDARAAETFRQGDSNVTIQDTLLDEASIANFAGLPGLTNWISPVPTSGTANRIDSYISAVGRLHSEGSNFILQKPALMSDLDFHSYPITWYGQSLNTPTSPASGFPLSITNPSASPNNPDTYFYVSSDRSVTSISPSSAADRIAVRDLIETAYLPVTAITGAVQYAGHVVLSFESQTDPQSLLAVASPSIQLIKHSPSYAWLPITIPLDASTMLFDFKFQDVSPGDWLSVGVNDTLVFSLEAMYLANGQDATSTPLDVSQWAGQNVDLFLGLNNVDDNNPGGSITVHDIRFGAVPEPSTLNLIALCVGLYGVCRRYRRGIPSRQRF